MSAPLTPSSITVPAHPSARPEARPLSQLAWLFGAGALAMALCVRLPGLFTSPVMRDLYPAVMLVAFAKALTALGLGAGIVGLWRDRAAGALLGAALALGALAVLGAGTPWLAAEAEQGLLGLDWLVVDGLMVALLILPLERTHMHRAAPVMRPELRADMVYFLVNHLAIHGFSIVGVVLASGGFGWARDGAVPTFLGSLPLVVQVLFLLVVADLVQYALHRAMHEIPWLWKIHAVHHSSRHLDAIAGSRIHLLETLTTRSAIYAAFFALGFTLPTFLVYGALMAVQGSLIHANARLDYGWLERFIVSPRYHHWHHASDAEAIDTNYAGTFPILDRLFGTWHLPGARWPVAYGTVKERIPGTVLGQQLFPFRR